MKILLIYPYCLEDRLHQEDASVMPMGVYYIGALLKENQYDVEIINCHNISNTPQKIKELLTEKKPDVIGFSILNANRWGGVEIAGIAKQINPKTVTVFGGIGSAFLWEHFLTHFKVIDFIVAGEGEYSFLNLIKCIENQDYDHIENLRGIAFRKGDKIVKNPDPEPINNIDSLPVPAKYFEFQHVSLTRGCPGNCTFCGSPQFWGRKVRFHSSDYFVDQLELLYKKGITFFYFSDDTFTLKPELVTEICRKILKRGIYITWAAISHVNYVSDEVLYWMRKAGCVQISYGVESGSEEIRKLLNKNIKTEQIRKAFALTVKYGILARAYFIYGCPGENWDTVQETLDLISQIKPLSIIFYILDIFPGTALYSDFKARLKTTDDIWLKRIEDIMYFENDPDLSEELILAFGQKLRSGFYENLSRFADETEVTDDKEFYEMHSDFFSKLAMTFSHGDYSQVEAIKDKLGIAEKLYKRSLHYHPNYRAYLGLGIIKQKTGDYEESVKYLSQGIEYFPGSEQLNICMGISCMNKGEYARALPYFLKFQESEQVGYYISKCYQAVGDTG
ncbi:MAG: radical SAM protein [Desulfobacterales bacterium]|nr:radical SAM protein [Desulfobacterales bacterium]